MAEAQKERVKEAAHNLGEQTAYPSWELGGQGPEPVHFGLTKREEFAKAAMIAIMSGSSVASSWNAENTAKISVRFADALLDELAK